LAADWKSELLADRERSAAAVSRPTFARQIVSRCHGRGHIGV